MELARTSFSAAPFLLERFSVALRQCGGGCGCGHGCGCGCGFVPYRGAVSDRDVFRLVQNLTVLLAEQASQAKFGIDLSRQTPERVCTASGGRRRETVAVTLVLTLITAVLKFTNKSAAK